MTSHDPREHSEATLTHLVNAAMEDAGLQGLCRDGQIEFAVDRLRLHRPDWAPETAAAYVRDVAAREARCRRGPAPLPATFHESRTHFAGIPARHQPEFSMVLRSKRHEIDHALRAELEFRAVARRNKRLGQWLAAQMGLHGTDAETYATEVVHADLEKSGHEDVIAKVMKDVAAKGLAVTEHELRAKMDELLRVTRGEIAEESGR